MCARSCRLCWVQGMGLRAHLTPVAAGLLQPNQGYGSAMLYRFRATESGTFWYHGHYHNQVLRPNPAGSACVGLALLRAALAAFWRPAQGSAPALR